MLIAQRQYNPVVSCGGLQLEVEAAAETFPERQPPGFVDASPERRMDHQLHATGFIEESLSDDGVLGGHRTQGIASGENILDGLLRSALVEAAVGETGLSHAADLFAQV